MDGGNDVVAPGRQQRLVGERAGRDDPRYLALDRSLAGRRVADLLADRYRFALAHQLRQVALDGVIRYAGHRDRVAGGFAARRQRNIEQRCSALRVVVEQLVEVAHAVKDEHVGILGFHAKVLAHHRRVDG